MGEPTVILRDNRVAVVMVAEGRFAAVPLSSADAAAAARLLARTRIEADRAELAESGSEAALAGVLAALDGVILDNVTLNVANRTLLAALDHTLGLPAFLSQPGHEGVFTFDAGDRSAEVAADSAQGIYVAEAGDPTGASGAWVRVVDGPISAAWFGLIEGDDNLNGAANSAAMIALQAALAAREVNVMTNNHGLERVLIPYGVYWFADNGAGAGIDIDQGGLILEGVSVGYNNSGSILKFPAGVTGIRVQNEQSSGALGKDAVAHASAQGTILKNLILFGEFDGSESEAHGVHARTTITCEDIKVAHFAGDAFHFGASASAADGVDPGYGNVNVSVIDRCSTEDCRDGLLFDGGNANACIISGFNANGSRRWGINDSSQLGNSYFGGQLAGNGVSAHNDGISIGASVVSFGGNRYGAIVGQEAGASTNAPSGDTTDNAWWYYIGTGGAISGKPAWTSGMLVRAGGAVRDDNVNSRSVYSGVYAETDQGKAQIIQRSLVAGGFLANWVWQNPAATQGTSVINTGSSGLMTLAPAVEVDSGGVTTTLGAVNGNSANIVLRAAHPTVSPSGHTLGFDTGSLDVRFAYNNSTLINSLGFIVTGPATTRAFGRGAAVPGAFYAPLVMLGDGGASPTNARLLFNTGGGAPAAGEHAVGEIALNRGAGSGLFGHHCTVAGTPGTWEPLYGMIAAKGAGYVAWTGTASRVGRDTATVTLEQVAQWAKALTDDLKARGVI